MRKVKIAGVVFFAALALGALSAPSSFAAGEWLLNGKAITTATAAVAEGKILLLVLNEFGSPKVHIICSIKLKFVINPTGKTKILLVEGLKAGEEDEISCEVLHLELGACSGALLAIIRPIGLPWKDQIRIIKAGEFDDEFLEETGGKKPGFSLECTLSGGSKASEECEGNVLTEPMKNLVGGEVEAEITNDESEKCKGLLTKDHLYELYFIKSSAGSLSVS